MNNDKKKNLNKLSLNNSKYIKKILNHVSINKNIKKKISPQIKGDVFIKKKINNIKFSKYKYLLINTNYRNNIIEKYQIKPNIMVKSCSSNYMKKHLTINTSRGRNNFRNIDTPITLNKQSYNNSNILTQYSYNNNITN